MPLFDYLCRDCGKSGEFLVAKSNDRPTCGYCGGGNMQKLLSAHSSMSGVSKNSLPGSGDTACCGSSPAEASCAGPGSCCGNRA